MDIIAAISDEREQRLIENVLTNDKRIGKFTSFNNGESVIKAVKNNAPDTIILDLFLPGVDGFTLLEEIRRLGYTDTKIIIIIAVKTDAIITRAFALGADYVIIKPYDVNALKRRVLDMAEVGSTIDEGIERQLNDSYIEKNVSAILNNTGIFPNLKGYKYLKSAILYGYKDESMLDGITKVLYPRIARENNTTGDRVERAIRHAIESAWKKYGGNDFYEKMGFPDKEKKQRPTNSEYIYAVLEYLKNSIIAN